VCVSCVYSDGWMAGYLIDRSIVSWRWPNVRAVLPVLPVRSCASFIYKLINHTKRVQWAGWGGVGWG